MNLPPTDLGTASPLASPPGMAPGNPGGGTLPGSGRAQFGQAASSALGMK